MITQDPASLTHAELTAAPANQRADLVESFLVASIKSLNPQSEVDAGRRLADLGIDSLQVVELKFALDQLLGQEIDVELIIGNPTVGELAASSIAAAGL